MILYSYEFKPISKLTGIPDSQTFFGGFCYYYLKEYGEEELTSFLKKAEEGNPDFIVSSFFVKDFLPQPMNLFFKPLKEVDRKNTTKLKKIKKINYWSISILKDYYANPEEFCENYYQRIISNNYLIIDSEYLVKENEKLNYTTPFFVEELITRNYVAENVEDKKLFYNVVMYNNENTSFSVYIKYLNEGIREKVEKVISKMIYISLGGGKSIGYNMFNFISAKKIELNNTTDSKMLLSKALLEDLVNIEDSYYKLVKLQNIFHGIGETKYKKKVLAFCEGSTFKTTKEFCGQVTKESLGEEIKYTNLLGLLV